MPTKLVNRAALSGLAVMAIGADTWDVLRRFVGQASVLTLVGVVLGGAASLGIARLLRHPAL